MSVLLGAAPPRSLVTSHAPALKGAPLYWVLARHAETTTVRSVASGRVYDWPNDRQVEISGGEARPSPGNLPG